MLPIKSPGRTLGRSGPEALDKYRKMGIDLDEPAFGMRPEGIPAYAAESEPGDVVVRYGNIYHASFGGKVGRRMFAMTYCTVPRTEGAVDNLRKSYNETLNGMRPLEYGERTSAGAHQEAVLNSDRPRMKQMMQPLIDLGFV